MKTVLMVVGRTTDAHLVALIDDYRERIGHYIAFDVEVIPELRKTKSLTEAQQKQREGELLLKALRAGDMVVLLDEGGQSLRSVDFARKLSRWFQSARRLVFVVGGPYGFSPDVYQRATERLSLSPMTFSHQMVRLVFIEQLYRALTILHGEPYHHE